MPLIPAFEIDIWNAWIPMLYFPLHPLIMIVADKLIGVGDIKKKMADVPYTSTEKKIFSSMMIVVALAFVYSIFLPLKLGTIWFYISLFVYLLGLAMLIIAIVNTATTPHGKSFTKGLYRYSRHPMIFWGNIIHLGVGIATASWVFIIFAIVYAILWHYLVIPEERGLVEQYGDTYREYMNRTPRWIGMPKSGES